MEATQMKAIDWPKAIVGGREYVLRLGYTAHAQIAAWGFSGEDFLPSAVWGAAMAGNFDRKGKWKSAAFKTWQEFSDLLDESEMVALTEAVTEAIKKVYPEAAPKAVQASPEKPSSEPAGATV